MSSSVACGVIVCYQVGYGIAAFGIGPLHSAGLTLPEIYGASAAVAAVLGLLSSASRGPAFSGCAAPQASESPEVTSHYSARITTSLSIHEMRHLIEAL